QQRPRAERARRRLARARRLRQARQDLEGGDLEIDAGVDGDGGRELERELVARLDGVRVGVEAEAAEAETRLVLPVADERREADGVAQVELEQGLHAVEARPQAHAAAERARILRGGVLDQELERVVRAEQAQAEARGAGGLGL